MKPGDSIAIAWDKNGKAVVHRLDCPEVRRLEERGVPVIKMIGIQRVPPKAPDDITRHSCLA